MKHVCIRVGTLFAVMLAPSLFCGLMAAERQAKEPLEKNPENIKTVRVLAEQGNASAQCFLGNAYFEGKGVPQNYVEAVKWWDKASKQGYAHAQSMLANAYHKGIGVPKDYGKSIKIYRSLAEAGDAHGQAMLSDAYTDGKGLPLDFVEAYKWIILAIATTGDETKIKFRDAILLKLTPEQIAEGQKRAAEFKPKKSQPANT